MGGSSSRRQDALVQSPGGGFRARMSVFVRGPSAAFMGQGGSRTSTTGFSKASMPDDALPRPPPKSSSSRQAALREDPAEEELHVVGASSQGEATSSSTASLTPGGSSMALAVAVEPSPNEDVSDVHDVPPTEPVQAVRVEEPPPPVNPLQEGGYLVFSYSGDGTLTCHFAHEPVEGALAYFKPKKIVPAFKYRQNAGRIEIIRKLQSNHVGYFDGIAQFIKMAKEFDSEIYLLQPVARIYYFNDGNTIKRVMPETFVSTKGFEAFAAIPKDQSIWDGVRTSTLDAFVGTGNKYGKAIRC